MSGATRLFDVMAALPPDISVDEAEAIARERWGIQAVAQPLSGERDRNFHLRAADGREFVLKFANPAEDAGLRDMQIEALRHVAMSDPGLAVPRAVRLPDGAIETPVVHASGVVLRVRLLTWVGGQQLGTARPSAAQRTAYGATVARLQRALAGFDHAARDHVMVWDLQHAPKLRDIAYAIPHDGAREVLGALLDDYDARVVPALPDLPRQIVHNDLNRMNVLVDPADHDRIAGVIDFGDIAHTATIFDVAIAAVAVPGPDMPMAVALGHFLRGYHAGRTLLPVEIELLPQLMATRIALGMTLASWHRHTQPDNPHFDLTGAAIERRLELIGKLRAPGLPRALREAIEAVFPSGRSGATLRHSTEEGRP